LKKQLRERTSDDEEKAVLVHAQTAKAASRAKQPIVFPDRMVVLKNTSLLVALRQCLRQAW
jgi:hypothetical protein